MSPPALHQIFNSVDASNVVALCMAMRHSILTQTRGGSSGGGGGGVLDFIALDCEFSGLGDGKGSRLNTRDGNIQDRYLALVEVVKKHSLLALGLTAFSKNNEISSSSSSSHRYSAHNFNFTLLPTCSFTIQPSSAAFLVDNGFDFSTLFSRGIRFTPGSCSTTSASSSNATTTTTSNAATPKQHQPSAQQLLQQHEDDLSNQVMRSLFAHIMSLKTPIVLHNGLLDLMFLYYSFHADLPASLDVFLADVSQMFPAGIYDTKFIAEYVERERASYLAYLYRKYEREQTNRQRDPSASFVSCEIQGRLKVPVVVNAAVSSPSQKLLAATKAATAASGSQKRKSDKSPSAVEVCQKYADHGYCMFGNSCPRSHDLDIILDQQEAEELQKKRQESNKKRFKKSNASGGEDATAATEESMAPVVVAVVEDQPTGSADGRIAATSSLSSKRVVPVKMSMATAAAKSSVASSYSSVTNTPQLPGSSSGDTFETYHSAHFDAYMTAFVFARQKLAGLVSPETISDPSVGDPKNKLYLMGKPIPLRIEKSAFVKYSKGHMERWEQLKRENVL